MDEDELPDSVAIFLAIISALARPITWWWKHKSKVNFKLAPENSVSDPDPDWIRIQSGQRIRIRIQEPQK
jgi:hypothetical protein